MSDLSYGCNTEELPFRIMSESKQANIAFTFSEDDARRFVACVNACSEIKEKLNTALSVNETVDILLRETLSIVSNALQNTERNSSPIENNGWISVTDHLPEWPEDESERVLVYSQTHTWHGSHYEILRKTDFYHHDPDMDDEEMGTSTAQVVTHWMPLPEMDGE